jgi:hypothetical protein
MFDTLAGGGAFFEGPRWHDGRWWVSDFYREAVYTYDTAGHEEEVCGSRPSPPAWAGCPTGRC